MINNLPFFAHRFAAYNASIMRKFRDLYGIQPPARWRQVALFTDGTQRKHHHDVPVNYSGHKKYYCFGYLLTVAPDGSIVDVPDPFTGRKNDHMKQNESDISNRLAAAQQNNQRTFDTATDKGFHLQPHVIPLHNNLLNTPMQRLENQRWSAMRVCNENMIGVMLNQWKYLDQWKHHNRHRQPLATFVRVGAIMTNVITSLDWNQTSSYYDMAPLEIEELLV